MTRIHLAYATPLTLPDKLAMRLIGRRLGRPSWRELRWPSPMRAPLSITYHLARGLAERHEIQLYDLRERIVIPAREGDILLGHPWHDPGSVLWRNLFQERFRRSYVIAPYNHDPRQVAWAYPAIERCDKFFAICGEHWLETFDRSPFAPFRHKIVRLDMGIDTTDYPPVKNAFNRPGERRFFYIGRTGHEKGIDLLERLAAAIPGFRGGYICQGGEVRGWTKICDPTHLTPELMARVAAEYDVFINMSRYDAQVTTVLEAMSWGFPVACSRESGYSGIPDLFHLDLHDLEQNIATIRHIQGLADENLARLAHRNRELVATTFTWDRFVATVRENL